MTPQEVHIIHSFPKDFYGRHLNLSVLGFIRPEYDYISKESLIDDIKKESGATSIPGTQARQVLTDLPGSGT